MEALKSELIAANDESETVYAELEQLRSRALDSQRANADEFTEREEALREAREEAERLRDETEDWRRQVMAETVRREQAEISLNQAQASQATLEAALTTTAEERDRAVESAGNLQAVLEEFQAGRSREVLDRRSASANFRFRIAAKNQELRSVLAERSEELAGLQSELAEFTRRARTAEVNPTRTLLATTALTQIYQSRLLAAQADNDRVVALAREVKEKNSIIGKLRHEGTPSAVVPKQSLRILSSRSSQV